MNGLFVCSLKRDRPDTIRYIFSMRLDLFLKASRLVIRRTEAQASCDAGRVRVNGAKAKPSKEVKPGDELEVKRRTRRTRVEIVEIPATKQVSKVSAPDLYRVIEEETLEDDPLV